MHQQTFHLVEPLGPADHVRGPDHAPVTVVEYGDFECPHCKKAVGAVNLMLARFASQVRFAFRPFPLEGVHPHALLAAQAAECAGSQGKFWEMHDLLFEKQDHLELRQILDYARMLGLDMERFTADIDDAMNLQRVRTHQRTGDASGVRGTPTFFVNGEMVDVSYGLRALLDAVEDALCHETNAEAKA